MIEDYLMRFYRHICFFVGLFLLSIVFPHQTLLAQDSVTLKDSVSGVEYIVEKVLPANFPTGLVFTEDGRLFYNEKNTGNVRLVDTDGNRQYAPVINFPVTVAQERGMIGIELDPNFEENQMIWVFLTRQGTNVDFPTNQIVRFRLEDGIGVDPEIMFDLPIENGNLIHNAGNLRFNKDGILFVSIGDYGDATFAQDTDQLMGKILAYEVTDDGLVPYELNPFENNPIYAYGFRNPFDFVFDPISGNLIATENGPDCDDEINLILRGFNYGWGADYTCVGYDYIGGLRLYSPPLLSFTPTIGPAGITIYHHDAIPQWNGDVFFCDFAQGVLRRGVFNEKRTQFNAIHEIDLGFTSCRLDIAVSPDGMIYFGTISTGDGGIYRIRPAK